MSDLIEVDLTSLSYIGIATFFVNLSTADEPFVYETLEDGSLQIYTTKHKDELTDIFKDCDWLIYNSIEVYTLNVNENVAEFIEKWSRLEVKKGFVSA